MELLAAIAIIAVLAGMLLPTLCAPRETARRSTCLNNLKQIGLAMRLYSGDYNGRFPTDISGTTVGSFGLMTNNYQTSYKTWICPSDPGVVASGSLLPFTRTNLSYAYAGFGLTEKVQPDTPLACDRSSSGNLTARKPWANNAWTHKSDGGNVLFADGHVEFLRSPKSPMYRAKNP